MGLRFTYPKKAVFAVARHGVRPLARCDRRGERGRRHLDDGRAARHAVNDNDNATQPPTTTTPRRPARADHEHLGRPGAGRPVDDHDHGAATRGQPAQLGRPDTARRGPARFGGAVPEQQRGVFTPGNGPNVPSYLSSPGGPYLYDANGRVILLHGVNVVYKHAPYIAYPDPGEPWNFDATDAAKMQRLGFNVVRLGIEWQALEPGSGGPNQPQVCTPGAPGNAHEWNRAVAERYLRHVAATVKLLAHYGIYTLLDMHQDVYNQNFRGEGAPNWAVCTNNVPIVPKGGRWSNNYSNPTLQTAVGHFWSNDVVGNLQGNYDLVWKTVAQYFKNDPWVVGYDPYNEPFSTETQTASESTFTGQLECFYIGKAHSALLANGAGALTCPAGDPNNGVIPTIQSVDSHHLTFVEPDIYWVTGGQHSFTVGPTALQARRLQLPHLLRRSQPGDRQSHRSHQVPAGGGDRRL